MRAREKALRALDAALTVFPNLRITQLVVNATTNDPYNVTDENLAAALDAFRERHHRPLYTHDCTRCRYLETVFVKNEANRELDRYLDAYICDNSGHPGHATLVLRYGSEGREYESGPPSLWFTPAGSWGNTDLTSAQIRAWHHKRAIIQELVRRHGLCTEADDALAMYPKGHSPQEYLAEAEQLLTDAGTTLSGVRKHIHDVDFQLSQIDFRIGRARALIQAARGTP